MAASHICMTTLSSKMAIARPLAATQRPRAVRTPMVTLTVAMAAKAKAQDLRTEFSTNEAIDAEVQKLKNELFSMRIKFAKREEYNAAAMKAARKRVAQLLTIRRQRELEQGIDKRASRLLEKAKLVEAGLGKFA